MNDRGRIDLRLTPAELEAYARAAGPLGIAAWARAVLSETAGIATLSRGRGPDKTPRKPRAPKVAP